MSSLRFVALYVGRTSAAEFDWGTPGERLMGGMLRAATISPASIAVARPIQVVIGAILIIVLYVILIPGEDFDHKCLTPEVQITCF